MCVCVCVCVCVCSFLFSYNFNAEHFGNDTKFLSHRIFRQLSSSSLLYSQRFGGYAFRPSSGVLYLTRMPILSCLNLPLHRSSPSSFIRSSVVASLRLSLLFLIVAEMEFDLHALVG